MHMQQQMHSCGRPVPLYQIIMNLDLDLDLDLDLATLKPPHQKVRNRKFVFFRCLFGCF